MECNCFAIVYTVGSVRSYAYDGYRVTLLQRAHSLGGMSETTYALPVESAAPCGCDRPVDMQLHVPALATAGATAGDGMAGYSFAAPSRAPNWTAIGVIFAAHAAIAALLVLFDVVPMPKAQPIMVVALDQLSAAPPPEAVPEPEFHFEQPDLLMAPPPDIRIAQPPATNMVTATVVKPRPVASSAVVAAPPAPPRPAPVAAPMDAGDLASRVLDATPPSYPMMSRRLREQGVVVLLLLVDERGRVAEISVRDSSGFHRLDKAARDAVRRWRWSPTLVDGQPVKVRGLVEIPFVLKN